MVVSIGDLHLSDDREWSYQVSKDAIEFILTHELNNKNNVFIFLGDITDKSTVSGAVTDLILTLFKGIKAKETYICMGNHEGILKHGKLSTTYDFLENSEIKNELQTKLSIIRKIETKDIENMTTLFLPHIYFEESSSLKDYESLPPEIKDKSYDLIIGHITDSRCNFPSSDKVDISYLKTKQLLLGHIHSGELEDLGYQGSLIPNSVAESEVPRFIRTIEKREDAVIVNKHEIPKLLEYKEVNFPDYLPRTKAKTIVWTINNCTDPEIAKLHYKFPDMYIRKCVYVSQLDKDEFNKMITTSDSLTSFSVFLKDWLDSKKTEISEKLQNKIKHYAKV
jgi:predicted MPP superfamily phosphohydrolase